jgi:hypothetical protein
MKTQRRLQASIVALVLAAAVSSLGAQSGSAKKPAGSAATLSAVQALPLTCAQAWVAAHRSYPEVRAVVTTLAKVSLANRNLTFPNSREAGFDAGKGIADDCKADPDALLFAIVDKHVRRVVSTTNR